MKSAIAFVTVATTCVALTACGGPSPTPVPPVAKPQPAPSTVAAARPTQSGPPSLVPAAPTVPVSESSKYADKGRKDPFTEVQLTSSLGGLAVATTKLTGIVRGGRSVLALLETQEGIGYILKPGDTLGDGRLMEVGADNVVFVVGPKPGTTAQRVVLRLAAN